MHATRTETDLLGEAALPAGALHGIHTARALQNFALAGRPVHRALVRAYGDVKRACAIANRETGAWRGDDAKAEAIEFACAEMAAGALDEHVVVDALQGGAGTSTNMNVNEVLANRALFHLGLPPGTYHRVDPLDDLNLHQSTNDTYPTALRVAALRSLARLEAAVLALQESFQSAEKRMAPIVKVARTQLQDAVLTTLGRSMGAFAEAFNRDRWRLYKCQERLRVVNLGGTAIGTGVNAPRSYIFRVVDRLRDVTGLGLARAENLVEATQNADVFAEVSGMLKAHAVSLIKICTDLRLLGSGPEAGFGELRLPPVQAGSSIMPGKVNPVLPEAATQAAMLMLGHDAAITAACAAGNLELNAFLPLVAHCLLEGMDALAAADGALARRCIDRLAADEARCAQHVSGSTALATALVPLLGYARACAAAERARTGGRTLTQVVVEDGLLDADAVAALLAPESVCRLGSPTEPPP